MDFDKLVKECGVGMTGMPSGPIQMPPGPMTQTQNADYGAEAESMTNSQLHSLSTNAERLKSLVAQFGELEPWVQSKLTLAEDYISTITHYLEYESGKHQGMGQMAAPTPVVAVVKPGLGSMMTKF
jgi:hypothetical protein